MKCDACGKWVENKLTNCTQWYQGKLIVIENVPAWVCEQCGETCYDPEVVEQIQNLIWSDAPPVKIIQTPVYDLSA